MGATQVIVAAGFGFSDLQATLNTLAVVAMLAAAVALAIMAMKGNMSKGMKIAGGVFLAGFVVWFANDLSSADPFFGRLFDLIDD